VSAPRPAPSSGKTRWESAVSALGVALHRMPSGAGHDAMKLHEIMPQAMLFVRGLNSGISHNPLESTTSDDMQLAVDAFTHLLEHRPGRKRPDQHSTQSDPAPTHAFFHHPIHHEHLRTARRLD
jgi:hypothetical protein